MWDLDVISLGTEHRKNKVKPEGDGEMKACKVACATTIMHSGNRYVL
jgi:hypothetical protein